MTLILRDGRIEHYRVLVGHDLALLQKHLSTLDARIRCETDPNGDGVVLHGVAANKAIVERAVEAAYRFFGRVGAKLVTNPRERRDRPDTKAGAPDAGQPVSGADGEVSPLEEEITQAGTRVVNLLTTDDQMLPSALRLQNVLRRIDDNIRVEEVNSVFVLRGTVASPAVLSRAIAIADRFVNTEGKVDVSVFSDRGGVLAGGIDEEDEPLVVADPLLLPRFGQGVGNRAVGAGGGAGVGGAGGGAGAAAAGARTALGGNILSIVPRLSPAKGNLAQNISRADVVTAANGRVVSLLQIAAQPRVEVKMNIVAVDRDRTDRLGINWRIDGSRVALDTTGVTSGTPPQNAATVIQGLPRGGLTSIAKIGGSLSIQNFLQALEQTGAGRTVSEPLLTAVSGEAASFLVGGSLPVPVTTILPGTPTQNGLVATNVAFIEFGLRIVARPTILENGRIGIVLDQIFTEPDDTAAIVVNGTRVPGFKQRSVRTVTESSDEETWAVAGLISDEDTRSASAIPLLSKIPVLGALFRNTSEQKSRSELIVTVTARRLTAVQRTAASATPGQP